MAGLGNQDLVAQWLYYPFPENFGQDFDPFIFWDHTGQNICPLCNQDLVTGVPDGDIYGVWFLITVDDDPDANLLGAWQERWPVWVPVLVHGWCWRRLTMARIGGA